jgi:D-aminopeptidase
MSSGTIDALRVNGVAAPKATLNAATARQFGVPLVTASGDEAIVAEASGHPGNIEGSVLRWSYGFHYELTATPRQALDITNDPPDIAPRAPGGCRTVTRMEPGVFSP